MQSSLLLELGRAEAEAAITTLKARRGPVSLADAYQLVKYVVAMSAHLSYTWEYPRRALGEAGLEAARFHEVCRSTIEALDFHLNLLALVRRLAEEVAVRESGGPLNVEELNKAEAAAREARQRVADLLGFVERTRPVPWEKVREGEAAFGRGECTRLNPAANAAGGAKEGA
jgi:hypothetical protein